MKLLIENWRKYLNDALEYDAVSTPAYQDIPPHLKKLSDEVQELDIRVQQAYEEGDPQADELDALFADKQHELETALSELEGEQKIGGEEEKYASFGTDELMRQFASIYRHYIEEIPFQGTVLTQRELIDLLRAWAQDYGWSLGGFKQETSDEQLLDAAKDSYETLKRLLRK